MDELSHHIVSVYVWCMISFRQIRVFEIFWNQKWPKLTETKLNCGEFKMILPHDGKKFLNKMSQNLGMEPIRLKYFPGQKS